MTIRKKDLEEANKEENKLKQKEMITQRSCTDALCCSIFFVFILAMVGVSVFAFKQGEPMRILTPFDSDGNECG